MKKVYSILLIIIMDFSCKKNDNDFKYVDAIVVYTGNPDVD
jgi:hypothetical protein